MYDDSEFGDGKFGLQTGADRHVYRLVIRSVDFHDAGAFYCQSATGQKTKAALTVRPRAYMEGAYMDWGQAHIVYGGADMDWGGADME